MKTVFLSAVVLLSSLSGVAQHLDPFISKLDSPTVESKQPRFFTPSLWALYGADVVVRQWDATTTVKLMNNPCWCAKDALPLGLARSRPAMVAYGLGFSTAILLAGYELNRHGHPKMAQLAKVAFATDIAFDGRAAHNNIQTESTLNRLEAAYASVGLPYPDDQPK